MTQTAMWGDPVAEAKWPSIFKRLYWKLDRVRYRVRDWLQRKALKILWRHELKTSNLVAHARREFLAAGYDPDPEEDGPNKWIQENLLELIAVFSSQGHSGFSGSYAVSAFDKLARFKPLVPLTGADEEWTKLDYGKDVKWQNKRCGRVFKDADGRAYDIEGRVFEDKDGGWYSGSDSRVYVEFPYMPTTEYVNYKGETDAE